MVKYKEQNIIYVLKYGGYMTKRQKIQLFSLSIFMIIFGAVCFTILMVYNEILAAVLCLILFLGLWLPFLFILIHDLSAAKKHDKEISVWITDENLIKTTAISWKYDTDYSGIHRRHKFGVEFNVESDTIKKVSLRYDVFYKSIKDKEIEILYSPKYDEVMILESKQQAIAANFCRYYFINFDIDIKQKIRYNIYNKAGNIETITENGKLVARYTYDGLNRLIREDNARFGTVIYRYDAAGNILSKTHYAFTLKDELGEIVNEYEYSYGQHGWRDQLLSFGEANSDIKEECTYDALGNPLSYKGRTLTWQGRRLISYGIENKKATYTYDFNNVRTSKTATDGKTSVTSKYIYDGNNLIAEQRSVKGPDKDKSVQLTFI